MRPSYIPEWCLHVSHNSDVQITHNVLSSGYDSFVVFQNYDILVANLTNIKYKFNTIKQEYSGFKFVSRKIMQNPIRYYSQKAFSVTYRACFLSDFQFVVPDALALTIVLDWIISAWFSFTNGSFVNNFGGGHGAIIDFIMLEFTYHYVNYFNNTISTYMYIQ